MVRDIGGGEGGGWREWEEKEEGWEEEVRRGVGGGGGEGGWEQGGGGGGRGARAEDFVLEWGRHMPGRVGRSSHCLMHFLVIIFHTVWLSGLSTR